jgi:hypothetical protein
MSGNICLDEISSTFTTSRELNEPLKESGASIIFIIPPFIRNPLQGLA